MGKPSALLCLGQVNAEEVPDYYDHITQPMDLGTMRERLRKGAARNWKEGPYLTVIDWVSGMNLIWNNCRFFNEEGSEIV